MNPSWGTTLLVALALPGPRSLAAGAPPPTLKLALTIRVAQCAGRPVEPPAWVEEHLAAANEVLTPHGIKLTARQLAFAPRKCRLLSLQDRDSLASAAEPGHVTVLVVEDVRDLAVRSYWLKGVHWRYRGSDARYAGRRWVILTSRARPPVLAHELAHYLGLPHDPRGGNLMTPGPSDPIWRRAGAKPAPFVPQLTVEQGRKLRAALRERGNPRGELH